jgi:Tol biopolymer transport system component
MKKFLMRTALLALIAVLGTGMTVQSAYDLFQKALIKEKAEGNLEEAIALFQQVVDRGDDESLAAQAQLHIGICYEKLGLGKARESYQKVIDRYPKQAEAVKTAREKLALLTAARTDKASGGKELSIRRVYDGTGPEWGNALSSDGRYLVYTDWETGDMALVDMTTQQHRRLTNTGGLDKPSGDMGETSAFSPDDKRIAYGWIVGQKVCELRVVNFDGTDPRVLFRDEEAVWIRPHAWSTDGKNILILLMRKDGTSEISTFSMADNKVSLVRKVAAKDPEMGFSPDGKAIAYSMPQEPKSSKRDIFLMKTDGSGHEAIVSQPSDDYLLGWAPDGKRLIFASDRLGSYGIWSIEVADGRAEGVPQWLKGELKPDPVRLTPDGTLYYMLVQTLSDVYTVPIDPETGKSLGNPTPVKSRYPGIRFSPDWSPDGTQLVYKTNPSGGSGSSGPASISVLDLRSGEERQITPGLYSMNVSDGPRWAPDGRSVLLIGNRGGEQGIYQIEIPGGATKLLVNIPIYQYTFHAAWSRDGKSIFYPQGNPVRILRRDLESGRDTELATMKGPAGIPRIALSPDGQWLAFTSLDVLKEPHKLMLVPTAGGPSREIYRTQEGEYLSWIQWTPDGRSVWLLNYRPATNPKAKPILEYLAVSPDGKNIRKLELNYPGCIHPDGRQVAFSTGQGNIELWALENFLPPAKGK